MYIIVLSIFIFILSFIGIFEYIRSHPSDSTTENFDVVQTEKNVLQQPGYNANIIDRKKYKHVTFDGNVKLYEYDSSNSKLYYDANARSVSVASKQFAYINNDHTYFGDSNISVEINNSQTNFKQPTTIKTDVTKINNGRFMDKAHFNEIHANNNICFNNQNDYNCITKSDVEILSNSEQMENLDDKIKMIRGACTSQPILNDDSTLTCINENSGIQKLSTWFDRNK
jgi:hypothetical protein